MHSIFQPRTESLTHIEKLTTLLGSLAGGHQRCRGRLPERFEVWDALVVPGRSKVSNERCEMRGLRCSQQVVASLTSAASVQRLKANTASAPTVASCVVVVNAIAVVVVISVACTNISVAVVDLHGREGGDEAFVVEVFAEVVGGDDVLACVKVRVLLDSLAKRCKSELGSRNCLPSRRVG